MYISVPNLENYSILEQYLVNVQFRLFQPIHDKYGILGTPSAKPRFLRFPLIATFKNFHYIAIRNRFPQEREHTFYIYHMLRSGTSLIRFLMNDLLSLLSFYTKDLFEWLACYLYGSQWEETSQNSVTVRFAHIRDLKVKSESSGWSPIYIVNLVLTALLSV